MSLAVMGLMSRCGIVMNCCPRPPTVSVAISDGVRTIFAGTCGFDASFISEKSPANSVGCATLPDSVVGDTFHCSSYAKNIQVFFTFGTGPPKEKAMSVLLVCGRTYTGAKAVGENVSWSSLSDRAQADRAEFTLS